MGKFYGLTLLVGGGFFLWFAIHLWHAKKGKNRPGPGAPGQQAPRNSQAGWHETVILLLILGGLGLGGGASLLTGLDFLYIKVGIFPLWSILTAAPGAWFLVDLVARRHWTRTSAMAFLTAAVIAVPIAPPALSAATHGQQAPQTVSVTHHKGGKG
jgi:hypothetical protein